MLRKLTLLVATALMVTGCSSAPPLESKSLNNVAEVDLSGDWSLRAGDGRRDRPVAEGEQRIRIPSRSSQRRPQRQSRSNGNAVMVFLENGRALRITQTNHGLFISFDRAVVEEYTFGENRLVSVGPIEAQRVSGWEGSTFVVETLDEDGVRLTESWSLSDDGGTLTRRVAVTKGEDQKFSAQQVFERG